MPRLTLIKTQAFGNDFLLADAAEIAAHERGGDLPALAREACDRHRGLGADGLMLLDPTPAGARTRLLNADGSAAEVSGNGVRCAAAWLAHDRQLTPGAALVIETVAGPKRLELLAVDRATYTFRADMGPPADVRHETIDVAGTPVPCVVMRVGNPQCVVLGPVTEARLRTIASALAVHPFFPEGTNVELAAVDGSDRVRILIWERGVGPTSASGTGACAAAVAAAFAAGAPRVLDVVSPGGRQRVEWTADTIFLTGWAAVVGRCEWWLA